MALGQFVGFIRSSIKSFTSLVLTLLSVALYVVFVYKACDLLVHLALSVALSADVLWVLNSLITVAFQPTTILIIIRAWYFGDAGEVFVAAFATMTCMFALFCEFSLGDPKQFYAFAQEAKSLWDAVMLVIAAMIVIVKVCNASWEPLCKLCTGIRQTLDLTIFFKIIKTAIYLFFIQFAFFWAASKCSDQENLSALLFVLFIFFFFNYFVAWVDADAEPIVAGAEPIVAGAERIAGG